jgi:Glu-tRNA(Gln) amidotransferase subunit E-like FAD-binding protein
MNIEKKLETLRKQYVNDVIYTIVEFEVKNLSDETSNPTEQIIDKVMKQLNGLVEVDDIRETVEDLLDIYL